MDSAFKLGHKRCRSVPSVRGDSTRIWTPRWKELLLQINKVMDDFLMLYIVLVGIYKVAFQLLVEWLWPELTPNEVLAWSLMIEFYWLGVHYLIYLLIFISD